MGVQKLSVDLMNSIHNNPSKIISAFNLTYITTEQMKILRRKNGKIYQYLRNNEPLTDKEELKRIAKLVIPPAWESVKIAELPNAHLQAVGRDLKKRKQYRYHPTWLKIRNQTKFYRMLYFGQALPKLRAKVDKDIEQKEWSKTKVLALVIKLLEETHIRIGNDQYAKRNKTYGLSTLRNRHLQVHKDKIQFQFVGKKGKRHQVSLRNKKLRQLVLKCEEIPGWELFQYYDSEGQKQSLDSGLVNEYIQKISGKNFTAKDFRTWAGTVVFFDTLAALPDAVTIKEKEKNILAAYDASAKALGNTRNVCRKYYVHPAIPAQYLENGLKKEFQQLHTETPRLNFSVTENVLLAILANYKPAFTNINS